MRLAIYKEDTLSFILDSFEFPPVCRLYPRFSLKNSSEYIVDSAIPQPLFPREILPRLNNGFIALNRYDLSRDLQIADFNELICTPSNVVLYLLIIQRLSIW